MLAFCALLICSADHDTAPASTGSQTWRNAVGGLPALCCESFSMMPEGSLVVVHLARCCSCLFLNRLARKSPLLQSRFSRLVGENYLYSIDFLFFKRLAEGELRFSGDRSDQYLSSRVDRAYSGNRFLADRRSHPDILVADGIDPGRFFAQHRTRCARSISTSGASGKIGVEAIGTITSRVRLSTKRQKRGCFAQGKSMIFLKGQQPVDMLTAFYNLRTGCLRSSCPWCPLYDSDLFQ